jgi:alpha-L-arabinofuranosidase
MNISKNSKFLMTLWAAACAPVVCAAADSITVQVDNPGVRMSPVFFGLMTEEINHSYDGGLYGELIRNRAFKDGAQSPVDWSLVQADGASATMSLDKSAPLSDALPVSLRLDVTNADVGKRAGVANSGYWGIPVKPDTTYRGSFYAKVAPLPPIRSVIPDPLTVSIESEDGATVYAKAELRSSTPNWVKYDFELKTGKVEATTKARFVISVESSGTIWLNLVSLFPPTFNDRPNGNRIDLMEMLGGMKPSFLRLPGGNYLEGDTIPTRFEWKTTIGDLEQRPGHQCPWGYRSSDGLGLLEYLEWCEDLKMEPVLAVYAGYSLRGAHVEPGPDLQPYVDDALDEIEYVTGDANTKWGAERVKDGHRAPFNLTYVEIGNEDNFDRSHSYDGRYAQFYDAIKAKYPNLQLIATIPVRSRKPDVVDDHYYRSARAMEADSRHYDKIDRNGPKIFVGEWASTEGSPTPTLNAALGDAAWLTGLERNSDLVVMEAYAPLLVNVNPGARQWATDLIGYDALNSFGSPSYYVQSMLANYHGEIVLPVEISAGPDTSPQPAFAPRGGIGVGTWNTQAEYKDIKVTRDGETLFEGDFTNGTRGWRLRTGNWSAQDGMLVQTGEQPDSRATSGDASWTDYTYELKARKTGGAEGFLILFHVQGGERYIWWNIGGWGNTRTVLERGENGAKSEFGPVATNTIETGRWYDLRVELHGQAINCYLDGNLVTSATDMPGPPPDSIYASASRNPANGDLFLQVVNVTSMPRQMEVNLRGVTKVSHDAAGEVLTGDPLDQNSLAEPMKVAPKPVKIGPSEWSEAVAPSFTHEFPAHSVTVLQLNAK